MIRLPWAKAVRLDDPWELSCVECRSYLPDPQVSRYCSRCAWCEESHDQGNC